MRCCFCQRCIESAEAAIVEGWYPDFWVGDVNYQGPICPECQQKFLITDTDGELVLKPEFSLPPTAVPSVGARQTEEIIFMPAIHAKQKFPLGQIVGTPGALEAIAAAAQTPAFFLDRHVQGDWGEVCAEDKRLNDQDLVDGGRLLSAYRTVLGVRIWIITEATDDEGHRAATTLLLPEEY